MIAKHIINTQIHEWHRTRFQAFPETMTLRESLIHRARPQVLIVDDDIDFALSTQLVFQQLGCRTDIATKHQGLHKKIIDNNPDYILLDWKLNDQVTANVPVEKAIRLIDTFSDLRRQFNLHRPQIVTFSAVNPNDILLPEGFEDYFNHLDHWSKSDSRDDIVERATELIELSSF